MIKCLFGVWQENNNKGLTPEVFRDRLLLVNKTDERIVFSPPVETIQGESHEIGVDPGEAVCFTRKDPNGAFVAVGPEAEMKQWVSYYFYDPELLPAELDLSVRNHMLVVERVPVISEVLQSYKPETVVALRSRLCERYTNTAQWGMVETLIKQMGQNYQSKGKKDG